MPAAGIGAGIVVEETAADNRAVVVAAAVAARTYLVEVRAASGVRYKTTASQVGARKDSIGRNMSG